MDSKFAVKYIQTLSFISIDWIQDIFLELQSKPLRNGLEDFLEISLVV